MKDYMKIYQEWLSNPYFDEATKEELRAIEGNENEIKERFYMDLEFGTAGLRGIIGAGTVSYTHLTMTTIYTEQISVVGVSLKKKKKNLNVLGNPKEKKKKQKTTHYPN